jgi:hypothetical protein
VLVTVSATCNIEEGVSEPIPTWAVITDEIRIKMKQRILTLFIIRRFATIIAMPESQFKLHFVNGRVESVVGPGEVYGFGSPQDQGWLNFRAFSSSSFFERLTFRVLPSLITTWPPAPFMYFLISFRFTRLELWILKKA